MNQPNRTAISRHLSYWRMLAVALVVSACGTKGPLFMPPKPGTPAAASATPIPAPAPAAKAGDPSTQEKTSR